MGCVTPAQGEYWCHRAQPHLSATLTCRAAATHRNPTSPTLPHPSRASRDCCLLTQSLTDAPKHKRAGLPRPCLGSTHNTVIWKPGTPQRCNDTVLSPPRRPELQLPECHPLCPPGGGQPEGSGAGSAQVEIAGGGGPGWGSSFVGGRTPSTVFLLVLSVARTSALQEGTLRSPMSWDWNRKPNKLLSNLGNCPGGRTDSIVLAPNSRARTGGTPQRQARPVVALLLLGLHCLLSPAWPGQWGRSAGAALRLGKGLARGKTVLWY